MSIPMEFFVAQMQTLERLYRARGAFDAAVGAQRHWEYVESLKEEDAWHLCCYRDRGIEPVQSYCEKDGQLIFELLNGAAIILTPQDQWELFLVLMDRMEMTSGDLLEIASHLWQRERESGLVPKEELS